jgi:hypothetical protein
LPKDPDRSHLADAIHFMDLIDLADEELPVARATVEHTKQQPSPHGGNWTSTSNGSGSTGNFTQKRRKDVNVVSSGKPSSVRASRRHGSPSNLPQLGYSTLPLHILAVAG